MPTAKISTPPRIYFDQRKWIVMTFQETDLNDLKKAKALLENPGVAVKNH